LAGDFLFKEQREISMAETQQTKGNEIGELNLGPIQGL
jgi:hypothetical protein